ncbi:hypothetical protein LMTR13_23940 [Bradyrhizobium icense]|uniref:Uncharacterized protein n=1 Tax=Bradyrhizobium icense TaxID=1274631 RepID=A0A1B1UJD0_9BRAD|nr:hypothetical protein LMTR13_23940 [Bradyrhizobium icense]
MAEGLVDGAAFAVDASLIAADANKQPSAAGSDEVDWKTIAGMRRSVREYLDTLDEAAWGAASETVPKFISKSDPAAQCPERLAADSAYGSAEMLGWLVNARAIEPDIPVFDKSARPMGRSRGKTSPTINKTTFTSARLARC